MVNVPKFQTRFFMFLNKMFVIEAEIHKMLVRIENREVFEVLEHLLYCLISFYRNLFSYLFL